MMRVLHRWPGLLAALLVMVIALSGAALSVFPALESLSAPRPEPGLSVAELASRVQASHPGVEQIRRSASGIVTAWWFEEGAPGSAVIDPATGQDLAPADPDPVLRWVRDLHRALFLGDTGRLIVVAGAALMLVLALTGGWLVAHRTGGWRRWFTRLRGPLAGRLHTEIARVAVIGLLMSSLTGLILSARTFELLSLETASPGQPAEVSGLAGMPLTQMTALAATPVSVLRSLTFPYPGDPDETFGLTTTEGSGHVDQGTGLLLVWADLTTGERLFAMLEMLHTGQGASILGLLLGLSALGVPVLGVTGLLIWLAGRRAHPRIAGNQPAARARTVILVGSEGGSTWGFATTLHAALTEAGDSVHVGPLSRFDPARHPAARRYLILAATYGDGDAPDSGKGFLARLDALKVAPQAPLAVLGFGDRSYAAYCGFAREAQDLARARGWAELLPYATIDRQSTQDFARWGRSLGQALGLPLELAHQPQPPRTQELTLLSRRDFGAEVQALTSILRFALPRSTLWQRLTGQGFARFQAGDLMGLLPAGSPVPRLYSLASGRRDGFVEIVVRKQPAGLCSAQLTALEPGDRVQAFLRPNPRFHAGRDRAGLILIGAGTGIGPLAGFIRANARHRPMRLYFGLRHPDSDFLYRTELADWQASGRLTRLLIAASRGEPRRYVQDSLRGDAAEILAAIRAGARIMVCGGRDMADGVAEALAGVLAPLGLTPAQMKAEGRYVEDVY